MASLGDYVLQAKNKGFDKKEIFELLLNKGYSKSEINSAFLQVFPISAAQPNALNSNIGFFERIKLTFMGPEAIFEKVNEPGMGKSVTILLSSIGFIFAFNLFFSLVISQMFYNSVNFSLLRIGSGLFIGILSFFLVFLGSFIYAGISHSIISMFGENKGYIVTYNAIAYSLVPGVLLSIIPLVGLFSYIYSIVLMIFGLSKYHNISKGKAATAALIPLSVPIVLLIIIFFLFRSLNF